MHEKRYVSFLGDSITTYEGCDPPGFAVFYDRQTAARHGLAGPQDTWWARVARQRGESVLVNASYSGSLVEGAGFPAGSSPERAAALRTSDTCPDEVIIFIGINDYGWGSAHNQAAGRGSALPEACDLSAVPAAVTGLAPEGALQCFADAYAAMLDNVKAVCPQADIWCCTLVPGRLAGAHHSTFAGALRGIPFTDYNETIRNTAALQGCRVADAAAFGLDYEALDGTHPTCRGMAQLAALIGAAMEGSTPDLGVFGNDADAWASEPFTCGIACTECPWVSSASNSWKCICDRVDA